MNYVYFIQSQLDKSYYVGSTRDLKNRVAQHNAGKTKSTKSKKPHVLVYYEAYLTYSQARKRELQIKKWNRTQKEALINKAP